MFSAHVLMRVAVQEEVPQAEWEAHFDMLLEWMLCPATAEEVGSGPLDPTAWQLMDWGARGTPDQCRLAAWVTQQRYLRHRGSLSSAAAVRLEVRRTPRPPAFQRVLLPFGVLPVARAPARRGWSRW